MRNVGTVFGVVAKLRPLCHALVLCSLSSRLDKFITHLFLSMYGSSVTKAPMSVSFRECLFLTFSFNLLALWLITLESASKCSWEIIDDNLRTRSEHCLSSCLILWWELCMRSFRKLQPVFLAILKPSLHLTGGLNRRLFGRTCALFKAWLNVKCSFCLTMFSDFRSKSK